MSDTKELLERARARFTPPEGVMDSLIRRRARKDRNRRIAAAALAIIVALVSFAVLIRTFRTVERPASEPTPSAPEGIFADVGGWIASSNDRIKDGPLGIWAVDPTRPNDPEARIQLSDRPGTPLAWSSDGSKLLILRTRCPLGCSPVEAQMTRESPGVILGCPRCAGPFWVTLFVLNADGTETRVVTNNPKVGGGPWLDPRVWIYGGSFSPDGSQVVFAASVERVHGIYTVDADGGTPRLVLAARPRTGVFNPAFSPDGAQIAYLDLVASYLPFSAPPELQSPSLRVVNADGTGVRVLHDVCDPSQRAGGPAWSPDGTHIAYSCEFSIWVVSADGSGIAKTLPGQNPYWSPDGSRILFELPHQGNLAIANADGTHVQVFGCQACAGYPAHAGPWNPLASAVPGEPDSTATTGEVSPFVYALAALGVVGVLVLAWRARRRTGER